MLFEEWCHKEVHISFQCPVGVIVGFEGKTASQYALVCRFMKMAHRLLPILSRLLTPPWNLYGLSNPPFEPLEGVDLKHLSLKTVLLLVLAFC